MDIQAEKIALIQDLLNTEDIQIIKAIKSIFALNHSSKEWSDLPDEVISDIKESLKQLKNGQGISHETALKTFKKWL